MKVGFKGVFITRTCFPDVRRMDRLPFQVRGCHFVISLIGHVAKMSNVTTKCGYLPSSLFKAVLDFDIFRFFFNFYEYALKTHVYFCSSFGSDLGGRPANPFFRSKACLNY